MRIKLRPYQENDVDRIRQSLIQGKKAPLYVLPTGGGKTFTFAYIAEQAAAKGNRVLVLEHRKELIRQASLSLAALGEEHRVIAPKNKVAEIRRAHVSKIGRPHINQEAAVAVASVQTLARRIDWLQDFNPTLVIIDEAHHAVAGTWARIIEALPKAKLLGVTATPCRTDGQGLGDVFDTMIEGPTMAELIELGNLVPPRVFAPPLVANLANIHHSKGDFKQDELAEALDKKAVIGDAVEHYKKLASGRPAIVFCVNVKHAKHVAQEFRSAGFSFEAIYGDMDDNERDRLIYGLADGSVQGLVSVDVLSEGTDVPVAEVAIFLRATESESLFLQQAGRVLRPAEGKTYGTIIDHVGNVHRHGMPQEDRSWTLNGKQKRNKTGDNDSGPRILQCPACYMAHPPTPACPNCGHIYDVAIFEPKSIAGDLQEMTADQISQQRKENRREQGRTQSVEDMVKRLGYTRGRAEKIIEARQEKERLQTELRELTVRWSRRTGANPASEFGYAATDIRTMKPKILRENIDRVSEALFMSEDKREQKHA